MADAELREYVRGLKAQGVPKEEARRLANTFVQERAKFGGEGMPAWLVPKNKRETDDGASAYPAQPTSDQLIGEIGAAKRRLATPIKSESVVRGTAQGMSAGFGDEAAAFLDAHVVPDAVLRGYSRLTGAPDMSGKTYQEARDAYRARNAEAQQENPKSYLGGMIAGGGAAGSMVPAAPGLMGAIVQGGTLGLASGAGTSDADLTSGKSDAWRQAAADALDGSVMGGAFGAAGYGLGKAVEGVARSVSPWVGRFMDAKRAGRIDEAAALPQGQEGVQKAAELAAARVMARDAALAQGASTQYSSAVTPRLNQPAPVSPVRKSLLELSLENKTSAGRPLNDAVPEQIAKVTSDLGDAPVLDDMLRVRRAVGETAGFGAAAPTAEQVAQQKIYQALRQGVREASPEVAQADDAYTAFKRQQSRRNDILFRREDGARQVQLADEALESTQVPPAARVGDEITAARTLGRVGDESKPALEIAPYLDELASQDPVFKQALDQLLAKKALEATRFGRNPLQSGLSDAVAGGGLLRLSEQGTRAAARRVAEVGDGLSLDLPRLSGPGGPAAMDWFGLTPEEALRLRERDAAKEKRR